MELAFLKNRIMIVEKKGGSAKASALKADIDKIDEEDNIPPVY